MNPLVLSISSASVVLSPQFTDNWQESTGRGGRWQRLQLRSWAGFDQLPLKGCCILSDRTLCHPYSIRKVWRWCRGLYSRLWGSRGGCGGRCWGDSCGIVGWGWFSDGPWCVRCARRVHSSELVLSVWPGGLVPLLQFLDYACLT